MKKIQGIILMLAGMALAIALLWGCETPIPEPEPIETECPLLREQTTSYFESESYQGNNVSWYTFEYNSPAILDCDLKFLYWKDSLTTVDTLYLEVVSNSNKIIGEAYYIIDYADPIDSLTCNFRMTQYRETFNGVWNNNGICEYVDATPVTPAWDWRIQFNSCCEYYNLGDTIRIYRQ